MGKDKISRTGLLRHLLNSFNEEYHHVPADCYDIDNLVDIALIIEKIIDYEEEGENGRPE